MNAINRTNLPTIGAPFEGGFFAGLFALNGETYGLIASPRAEGELEESRWGKYGQDLATARSYNDGMANTQAMAEAGSDLGRWMLALDIAGFTDWYLPSRDELELLYRNLKPTERHNYCSFRDGDNPSSLPVGYPYTKESPARTSCIAFADDGEQALAPRWYWSSTQCSPYNAWIQAFDDGGQDTVRKDYEYRARAVRRFKVTP
ncbi:Lcl domain-containing protein [Stutzerimonas nitrititolerans]|uniref:Lcl domain-containing protein n=1 Tax=Stutzerimonas nitrititolerans TaxID=2482751 RepID=UPI002898270E|nr:DUF1566 domain-containing protein [Stutzerimonas nitrititolerans]